MVVYVVALWLLFDPPRFALALARRENRASKSDHRRQFQDPEFVWGERYRVKYDPATAGHEVLPSTRRVWAKRISLFQTNRLSPLELVRLRFSAFRGPGDNSLYE